jgi:uncharacterized protein YjeT (DUF2065 family)
VNIQIPSCNKVFPQQLLAYKEMIMKWFLYAFSLIGISIGCCTILYTTETRKFVRSIFNNVDRKILLTIPFILGILFILSASATRIPWLIRVIGLMAVIEGVVFFLIPKDLYDKFIDWYINSLSDQTYRLSGILGIIIWIAILSWIL